MTYPLSSDVTAGQPTAAAHYNNLRADALRLGNSEADAVTLGALLARFEDGLRLEVLEGSRLRVPASPAEPVTLLIGGVPLSAVNHVDLSVSGAPSGAAGEWFVFAVQSAGSTTFTLEVNTSAAESSGRRLIGRFHWDGSAIAPHTLRTQRRLFYDLLLNSLPPLSCDGRLTLTSGLPVTTADVSGAGTVYFSPYHGNRLTLYLPAAGWRLYAFNELSTGLSGYPGGKNVDIFAFDNGGSPALESVAWSGDTVRAAALGWQDGAAVLAGDPTRRYLGTVRTSGSGVTEDSKLRRLVWNAHHPIFRPLEKTLPDASWTYGSSALRYLNNDSGYKLEYVCGEPGEVRLTLYMQAKTSSADKTALFAIGLDGAGQAHIIGASPSIGGTATSLAVAAAHFLSPAGYHSLSLLEHGQDSYTMTVYGSGQRTLDDAEMVGAWGGVMG